MSVTRHPPARLRAHLKPIPICAECDARLIRFVLAVWTCILAGAVQFMSPWAEALKTEKEQVHEMTNRRACCTITSICVLACPATSYGTTALIAGLPTYGNAAATPPIITCVPPS
jgi:uncharacterized membrane protein YkvI